jgi:hypothetical protein
MATITLKNIPAELHRELKKTRRGKSSQPEQGNNRDFKKRGQRNHPA